MAVTFNHLTTDGDTASNGAVYTTASVAPQANRVLFLGVLANAPSGQTTVPPTITGLGGLTWALTRQSPSTDALRTLYWFRATTGGSAPTAGALTLDFGAQTLTICQWTLYEASGVDTASPVVQSVEQRLQGGTNTSVNFPFDSAVTVGNGVLAAVGTSVNATITPGTGWTAGGQSNLASPTQSLLGMHSNTAVQSVAASWTGGGNTWVIGIEVKAAASGGVTGTGAATTTPATLSGAGTLRLTGSGALTATPASLAGTGTGRVTGGGTLTAGTAALSGSGTVTSPSAPLSHTYVTATLAPHLATAALAPPAVATAALAGDGRSTAALAHAESTATLHTTD